MQEFSDYFLEEELVFIREQATENEGSNRFSDETINFIHTKEWLRVAMPDYQNNKPLDAYNIALLFEALAYADGSLGWAINLGAGANMFLGYLTKPTSKELSKNKQLWFAGSGAITGKAIKTDGGFKLSGQWSYASGSLYASHFTANAHLYDENENAIVDNKNEPIYRSFIFPATKVEILDTWHTIGLRASCSNDYKVTDCFVPTEHSFDLTRGSTFAEHALYRYPFDAFATSNIAVMCTGITQHFIEVFERDIATKKPLYANKSLGDIPEVQHKFHSLKDAFYKNRNSFLEDIKKLWQAVMEDSSDIKMLEINLQRSAIIAADSSYELVMGMYRYCGMNTVYSQNELSKVVRDFLVATQHFAISPLQSISNHNNSA